MAGQVVFWDFDGTLAERPGKWSGALLEALSVVAPGHPMTAECLRRVLSVGFPWHSPAVPHPELNEPAAWWASLERTIAAAGERAGLAPSHARGAAALTRDRYTDPASWRVFPDVGPTLARLSVAGWRHVVLSNHVPELAELLARLGLADAFTAVVTSARFGYEKPHPAIFTAAQRIAGRPRLAWMVGDSPSADVAGARAAGMRAVLVRHPDGVGLDRAADEILATI